MQYETKFPGTRFTGATMETASFNQALRLYCELKGQQTVGFDYANATEVSPEGFRKGSWAWFQHYCQTGYSAEQRIAAWDRYCRGQGFKRSDPNAWQARQRKGSSTSSNAALIGQTAQTPAYSVQTISPDAFGEFDGPTDTGTGPNVPASVSAPAPIPAAAKPTRAAAAPGSIDAMIDARIDAAIAAGAVGTDEETVRALAREVANDVIREHHAPLQVEFQPSQNAPFVPVGIQHKKFPYLARVIRDVRLSSGFSPNVWLYGPPGTGKSHAAKAIAQAMGIPFYCEVPVASKFDFLGYTNAAGEFVSTQVYKAWTEGGIILFDEFRACVPAAILALAGALANGYATFPGMGTVERHKDCHIIIGDNLPPGVTSADYNGGFKQDKMLDSRFICIEWALDEALEATFTQSVEWLRIVRAARAKAAAMGIRSGNFTSRAVQQGDAFLRAGFKISEFAEEVMRGGITADVWQTLRTSVGGL